MPEIQALRTLAVGLVVAFHLYPARFFRSGFVGVDAFFVISGYLITSHLVREVERTGRIRLLPFYARRIRRLLPASMLVLVVAMVGTFVLLPARYVLATAREGIAATFYVENLWLAGKAVTYSASNDVSSAVQHYWSLSTEEQFYLVWPALILLGIFLGRRFFRGHTTKTIGFVLAALVVASLVHSVAFTATHPSAAYFVTTTRVWEFGIGALTAFFLRLRAPHAWFATVLRWAGLVAVLVGGVALGSVPFPSAWALVPTVGTAAIIVAGDTGRRDPLGYVVRNRVIQWLGDISYSIYLWHWPLLVLLPFALGHALTLPYKVATIAVTLVLSDLTRRFVEVPAQRSPWLKRSLKHTFLSTLAAMLAIFLSLFVGMRAVARQQTVDSATFAQRLGSDQCLGAAASVDRAACHENPFAPLPEVTVSEADAPWGDNCGGTPRTCWGSGPRPAKVVLLVGDSHAESIYYGLRPAADRAGWGIAMDFEGGCPATYAATPSFLHAARASDQQCADFGKRVTRMVEEIKPDLILATAYTATDFYSDAQAMDGYRAIWSDWTKTAPVLVLRDYPGTAGNYMPECLATHAKDPSACAQPRAQALVDDPQFRAAQTLGVPGVTALDLSDVYCDAERCYPVVGGIPVYYDHDHINRLFSKSLAVVWEQRNVLPQAPR